MGFIDHSKTWIGVHIIGVIKNIFFNRFITMEEKSEVKRKICITFVSLGKYKVIKAEVQVYVDYSAKN